MAIIDVVGLVVERPPEGRHELRSDVNHLVALLTNLIASVEGRAK